MKHYGTIALVALAVIVLDKMVGISTKITGK